MDYGSGYSLIKGIEAVSSECDEVIFVEGDLFYDGGSFEQVISSNNNVITANREFITSRKSVGHIQYTFHFATEVAVSRSIDNINFRVFIADRNVFGKDCYPSLTLQIIVIQH